MKTLKRILLFIGLKVAEIGGAVGSMYVIFVIFLVTKSWGEFLYFKIFKFCGPMGGRDYFMMNLTTIVVLFLLGVLLFIIYAGIFEWFQANWNYVKRRIP